MPYFGFAISLSDGITVCVLFSVVVYQFSNVS